jgi:hypothetical protein
MPKNPEPIEKVSQRGRIVAEGKEGVNFWIRAFREEKDVDQIHRELLAQKPGTVAHISINSEYRVSPELIYIYSLNILVDMIGVCGGTAIVFYASPEWEKEVTERRDKFTEYSVSEARSQGKLKEIRQTQPGKET